VEAIAHRQSRHESGEENPQPCHARQGARHDTGETIQESRSHHKHEGRKALGALLAEKQIQGMGQVEGGMLIGTS
jgi:hypothetical protein